MGTKVLIVEDEESASRLIATLCGEIGLSAQATRSGSEAQELLARAQHGKQLFSCVVLDLVLQDLDGFQVGRFVRGESWGAKLPLIVVSGVYKQPNAELMAQLRPLAYLAKPFEPAAMRDALSRACGIESGPQIVEGTLADKPAPLLYVQLLRQKATGTLTLAQGSTVRKLHFQQGQIRFAESNVKSEMAGAALVAAGAVKQASFDRAVALAQQQRIPMHEALATARVLTPEQLKQALKQQTMDAAAGAVTWTTGTHRFAPQKPEELGSVPDARVSPVAVLFEAAKRFGTFEAARAWLEPRAQELVARTNELDREHFTLRTTWPGEGVTPLASGSRTVQELLGRVKASELPLLHMLCVSGLLSLSSADKPAQKPAAKKAEPEVDDDLGKTFSPEETKARQMLFGERDHLAQATHYEVLGVEPSATADDVKAAYVAAAKRFHSDAFSGLSLGSAARVAEELFAKVNEAYQVLSDPNRRADYDVYLDRKAKGLPTDVGAILRAEGIFRRGEVLFKKGNWPEAEAAFREAMGHNGAEAEFHAYLGMCIFKARGEAEEGLSHVEKALQMDPKLKSGVLFAAQINEALGQVEKAKHLLRKALADDPEFADAKRELSRMSEANGQGKTGATLGRLRKK